MFPDGSQITGGSPTACPVSFTLLAADHPRLRSCGGVFVSRHRSLTMAKRAARRAKLHAIDNDRIHSLVFDQTPANDRDQSYIRKIRPRSDNQRLLMEAIESQAADHRRRPRRHRQDLPRHLGRGGGPRGGQRLAHRPEPPGRRGGREPGLPARRHAREARPLSAPPVGCAERPHGRQAPAPGARRRHDRDRPGRLHARPHPEQQPSC